MLEDRLQDLELRSHSIRDLQFAQCFAVLLSFLPHLGVKLLFMIKKPNLSPSHTYLLRDQMSISLSVQRLQVKWAPNPDNPPSVIGYSSVEIS